MCALASKAAESFLSLSVSLCNNTSNDVTHTLTHAHCGGALIPLWLIFAPVWRKSMTESLHHPAVSHIHTHTHTLVCLWNTQTWLDPCLIYLHGVYLFHFTGCSVCHLVHPFLLSSFLCRLCFVLITPAGVSAALYSPTSASTCFLFSSAVPFWIFTAIVSISPVLAPCLLFILSFYSLLFFLLSSLCHRGAFPFSLFLLLCHSLLLTSMFSAY